MSTLFLIAAICGTAYFGFAKRFCDFYTVAFFGALLYFMPGFSGYALYPSGSDMVPVELADETMTVFTIVLYSIWVSAMAYDHFIAKHISAAFSDSRVGSSLSLSALLLSALGLVGAVLTIGTTTILYGEKSETIFDYQNRWFAMFEMCALLAFVLAFADRRWSLLPWALGLLGIDMFIGFRMSFGVGLIAASSLLLAKDGKSRLVLRHYKAIIILLAAGLSLFIYKGIYSLVRLQQWGMISQFLSDPSFYMMSIFSSEPFITQAILNETIVSHFQSPGVNLGAIALYTIPFVGDSKGATALSAGAFDPQVMFPETTFGLGSNIWAEMLSYGDWPLLVGFILLFNVVLGMGSVAIRSSSARLRAVSAVAMSFWAFYIHRNGILFEQTLIKRVFICFFMSLVVSWSAAAWARGRSTETS